MKLVRWFCAVRERVVERWTGHSRYLEEIEAEERWRARCERAEAEAAAQQLRAQAGHRDADGAPALTAAEVERLAMLAEECGEIAQAVCKVLRHGWESASPFDDKRRPNRVALERELGDLLAVMYMMTDSGDLRVRDICAWRNRKRGRMAQWTHHQNFKPKDDR